MPLIRIDQDSEDCIIISSSMSQFYNMCGDSITNYDHFEII